MKSDLLIIIPAYNEEENIEKVVENLRINYGQYDYIVVNDGSRDSTAQICREKGFHLLDLPVNLGLAGAFQTGMKYAYEKGYAYAIQFDADGQHLPEYLDAMLERIRQGYDIVIGSRFVRFKKSRSMRMIGSRMITVAIKMTTGERIADRDMIREFAMNLNYGPEPDTVSYLIKNGAKVSEVQVEMAEREFGSSYLNVIGSMKYMLKMLLSIILVQSFRKR